MTLTTNTSFRPHFEPLQQRVLDYNDRLVNGAFISWADFDLWNAWLRVLGLGHTTHGIPGS